MKPILKWPGGKRHLVKYLLEILPDHDCYCEAFAGGLAMLLGKPPSKVEIVNDINGDLVALYRVAQFHLPELVRELSFHLCARDNIKQYLTQPGLTDIQRAARFLVRNHTSFAGSGTSFGVAKTKAVKLDLIAVNRLLENLRERLNGVTVENLPFQRCFKNYDGPRTLFFLDPPYLNAHPKAYAGWNEEQMTEFAECVKGLQGQWIVTVDDSPFNRKLFEGFKISAFRTRNRCTNIKQNGNLYFGEMVITSR